MQFKSYVFLAATVLSSGNASANPIPVPVPASMPLEEMTIVIGNDKHVTFTGDFTFDFIPDGDCTGFPCEKVDSMLFPLPPVNATNVSVKQDGTPLDWSQSPEKYPTVLPKYPLLDMFEWAGPFPEEGAVFTVNYEHDVFKQDDNWVLFYALGTGKFFPTYDKITTAVFDSAIEHHFSVFDASRLRAKARLCFLYAPPFNRNFFRK